LNGLTSLSDYWSIATATPLLLCSLIALTLIIERAVKLSKLPRLKAQHQAELLNSSSNLSLKSAKQLLHREAPFYALAASQLFRYQHESKSLRDDAVMLALENHSAELRSKLSALGTIGSLAPMLGLLGTIVGLMRSFHDIGLSQGPVEPAIVADGLWQALSTTAVGMIIAVLCLFFSAIFNSLIRRDLVDASTVLGELSIQMEVQNLPQESS